MVGQQNVSSGFHWVGLGITILTLETAAMGGEYSCCVNPQVPKETALRNSSSASTRPWLCEAIKFLIHLVLGSDTCNDSPSLQPFTPGLCHTQLLWASLWRGWHREQAAMGPKAGRGDTDPCPATSDPLQLAE